MPEFEPYMTAEQIKRICTTLEGHHLHSMLDVHIVNAEDGQSEIQCHIGPDHMNVLGSMHGGNYYTLLDVAAYCAAITMLPSTANATTHDLHVSVMKPLFVGDDMTLTAVVRRRGRSLMFIDAEAHSKGKLVASARITKSIVPFDMTKLMAAE